MVCVEAERASGIGGEDGRVPLKKLDPRSSTDVLLARSFDGDDEGDGRGCGDPRGVASDGVRAGVRGGESLIPGMSVDRLGVER